MGVCICLTLGLWQLKITIIPVLSKISFFTYLELLNIHQFHPKGPFPIKRPIYRVGFAWKLLYLVSSCQHWHTFSACNTDNHFWTASRLYKLLHASLLRTPKWRPDARSPQTWHSICTGGDSWHSICTEETFGNFCCTRGNYFAALKKTTAAREDF